MQTIFKEAVNEILGGKDGICAWMGQTLRAKALRLELWKNRDESDPDYNRWLKLTGLEHFDEEKEIAEFAKWVSHSDARSMVTYERTRWYLESFYAVITVPVLLLGLKA